MPLTQEARDARARGIGSSDAAAACGLDPWRSRVALWLEKTGRVEPPDLDDVEHIHFGNVLEDVVARECERRRGIQLARRRRPFVRGFMVANVDRIERGRGRIVECKNAGEYTADDWAEWVPQHYRVQVEHQLITADRHEAILAALIGGNRYVDREITRSPELTEVVTAREAEFWSYVERDEAPPAESAADVLLLFPIDSGRAKAATPEIAELHQELLAIRQEARTLRKRDDAIIECLQMFMGEDAELVTEEGTTLATWRSGRYANQVDWQEVAYDLAKQVHRNTFDNAVLKHARRAPRRFRLNDPTTPKGKRR